MFLAAGRLMESRGTSTRSDDGRPAETEFHTPIASTLVPLLRAGMDGEISISGA